MASKKSFSANMPAEMFLSEETTKQTGTPTAPTGFKPNPSFIETKSRRVQLLMQPSLHSRLKEKAQDNGLSFNDYVHQILEKSLEQE